jgi:hypothetical protein
MKTTQALIALLFATAMAVPSFGQQPNAQPRYPQGQPPPQAQYPQTQLPPAQGYPQTQYPAGNYTQPPLMTPAQLEQAVASIALYPDALLAQVLRAATFDEDIPEAAGWANRHAFLRGEGLARAIRQDNLPWDVSVIALIPFPQVLSQMAQYMQWTEDLGDAVLVQRGDVIDAIQRLRLRANQYGYFRDPQFSRYQRVQMVGPGVISIDAIGPDYYLPSYNSQIFFSPARRGRYYSVFSFGPAITIGGFFGSWGWGNAGFGWRDRTIIVDRNPWNRNWANRVEYQQRRRPDGQHGDEHGYRSERRWEGRSNDRRDRDRDHR